MHSTYQFLRRLTVIVVIVLIALLAIIGFTVKHIHNEKSMEKQWHMGIPTSMVKFGYNSRWKTDYIPAFQSQKYHGKRIKYQKVLTPFSGSTGYNPTAIYYYANHKYAYTGTNYGVNGSTDPYYKKYPHHTYEIISGHAPTQGHFALQNDVDKNYRPLSSDSVAIVRILDHSHIKLWMPKPTNPKKIMYVGIFHKLPNHEHSPIKS